MWISILTSSNSIKSILSRCIKHLELHHSISYFQINKWHIQTYCSLYLFVKSLLSYPNNYAWLSDTVISNDQDFKLIVNFRAWHSDYFITMWRVLWLFAFSLFVSLVYLNSLLCQQAYIPSLKRYFQLTHRARRFIW